MMTVAGPAIHDLGPLLASVRPSMLLHSPCPQSLSAVRASWLPPRLQTDKPMPDVTVLGVSPP